MDGLNNVAGVHINELHHNGKTYKLAVLGLRDHAEKEAYILSHKPNPLTLLDQLPPLPPAPKMPVPPDDLKDTAAMAKYHAALTAYQREKAQHDAALSTRVRLEESLRKEAMAPRFVSFDDETKFDNSLHGIGWRLWRALRANHPEIDSVQAALNLIHDLGTHRFAEVVAKLDLSDEKDLLGKSSGSTDEAPGQEEPPGH